MAILESEFQSKLLKNLKAKFPSCMILKNDAKYKQGVPDILVLCNGTCALLECKRSEKAQHRPNQDYYIQKLRRDGFYASFVYPENKEQVLSELTEVFG